ncbi:MAG: hypothetical protein R6V53_00770, partial [Candidatus Woesearchaeota archaeon]
ENLNALFIKEGLSQSERLVKLNEIAISQMKILVKEHVDEIEHHGNTFHDSHILFRQAFSKEKRNFQAE